MCQVEEDSDADHGAHVSSHFLLGKRFYMARSKGRILLKDRVAVRMLQLGHIWLPTSEPPLKSLGRSLRALARA